jgi:hypothetical protein
LRKYLIARLRPKRDQDIIEATRDIEPGLLSDMVRDAVRAALGAEEARGAKGIICWQIKSTRDDSPGAD